MNQFNYAANIEAILVLASAAEYTAGQGWYTVANSFAYDLSQRYNVPFKVAAAVVATISPRIGWNQNCRDAEALVKGFYCGYDLENIPVSCFKHNARKAWAFLDGTNPGEPTGTKVNSFYHNITHPNGSQYVTIDSHAINIALAERLVIGGKGWPSAKIRADIGDAYREVASKYGMAPCQLQAIVWLTWRRILGIDK
jgi:hypothetical protein